MEIRFSPFVDPPRRIERVEVDGDTLEIHWREGGQAFVQSEDFSAVPEGGMLPAAAVVADDGATPVWWLAGPVERIEGEIRLMLALPHASDAPAGARFPTPVSLASGVAALPACDPQRRRGPKATSRQPHLPEKLV